MFSSFLIETASIKIYTDSHNLAPHDALPSCRGSREAGFTNRGSSEEKPAIRLSNGMPARVWYLPIDGPGKPPRITPIDLAPVGWRAGGGAASASPSPPSHIARAAGVLSAAPTTQTETRLAAFQRLTGPNPILHTHGTAPRTDNMC